MIEVEVQSIRVSLTTEDRVILLKELESERILPIFIGPCEADAIALRLRDVEMRRPLTHDLLKNVITELEGEVLHINVNDLRGNTFYALITVQVDGKEVKIDSRPSDAIALAVRAEVPIYVEESVMEEAGITPEPDLGEAEEGEDLSAFRDFIDNLDLDDLPIQ